MDIAIIFFISCVYIWQADGVSLRRQLEHIARRKDENSGFQHLYPTPSRRQYGLGDIGPILGAPSHPSHLPAAEPILPGHTLIRPVLGMLKSAIKFPHRDPDNGAGVYGNVNNLGLRYDGKNERVLYSGFRRTPADYIMIVPAKQTLGIPRPKFSVSSVVLDMENKSRSERNIRNILQEISKLWSNQNNDFEEDENDLLNDIHPSFKIKSKKITKIKNRIIQQTDHQRKNNNKNNIEGVMAPLTLEDATLQQGGKGQKLLLSKIHNSNRMGTELDSKNEDADVEETLIGANDVNKKLKWLLSTKDSYNTIRIAPQAPNHNELLPFGFDNNDDIRSWWYYHQDDYKPFTE